MPDWGWIVLAVVVVFGASKLPDIARNLGRSSGEFKRGLKEGGDEGRVASPSEATPPTPTPPAAAPTEPPPNDARPGTAP